MLVSRDNDVWELSYLNIFQVLNKAAIIVSGQEPGNASLKDNWDDTDGYYSQFC